MHYAVIFNQLVVVRLFLARPSLNLTLKNLDDKAAFEYHLSKELLEVISSFNKRKQAENSSKLKVNILKASEYDSSGNKSTSEKRNPEDQSDGDKFSTSVRVGFFLKIK